jgi:hypothetical protein
VTGLVNPFGFDAVQWKIWVVTGWKMSSVMLVSVSAGFTPVHLGFGHPAVAPLTVAAAVRVAGLVVKVRFPFLIASAGMAVSEVGRSRQNPVLAGRGVTAAVLALVEREPAYREMEVEVLVTEASQRARTRNRDARRAGERANRSAALLEVRASRNRR